MVTKVRNIALIPLRGGSKGIPGKNLKELNGKPLCSYAINAALNSKKIDEVWVSSDDKTIIDFIKLEFPEVKIRIRPAEFATDTASTESVILDLISVQNFSLKDQIILIQATSPLIVFNDLNLALEQLENSPLNSLVSGVEFKRFLWNKDGIPINYDIYDRPRRQDFDGIFLENGAFYISTVETILKTKNRVEIPAELYLMREESAYEIDEISDWIIVESLVSNRKDE